MYEVVSEGAGLSDASLVKIGVDRAVPGRPCLAACACTRAAAPATLQERRIHVLPKPGSGEVSTAQKCKQRAREETRKGTT